MKRIERPNRRTSFSIGFSFRVQEEEVEKTYMDVEGLEVYQKLCKLHIEVCDISHQWPPDERYELGS